MQHVESWISCACAWFVLVYTKVIPLFLYFVFRIPWVPPFSWIVSLDATCPPPVGPTSIGGLASDPCLLKTPHPLLYRATRVISLFMFHTQSSLTMVFNLRKLSPLYSCSHKPLLWYCLFCNAFFVSEKTLYCMEGCLGCLGFQAVDTPLFPRWRPRVTCLHSLAGCFPILSVWIRESVDSLCRDGADVQYMQYLSKSCITSPQTR